MPWRWAAAAAVAALAAWWPVLDFQFLNFDDNDFVLDHVRLHSLRAAFVEGGILVPHFNNWNPAAWASHAVDWALFGDNPRGHHLTSLLLHAANAALVVALAARLMAAAGLDAGRARFGAGLAGLLFGLHPVQAEAVAWIADRKTLVSALFSLGALLAWLDWREHRRKAAYGAALALFALALLGKPMAVGLPLLLVLIEWYPLERLRAAPLRLAAELLPFVVLAVALAAVTMMVNDQGGALATNAALPLSERLLAAARSIPFYLRLLIWPSGLSPVYPFPPGIAITQPETLAALGALAALALGAVLAARRVPAIPAAGLALLICLGPVLGAVRVGVPLLAANRYLYLAALGILMVVAAALARLVGGFGRARIAAAAVLALGLAWGARAAVPAWSDSVAFWSRVIVFHPDLTLAYHGRGAAHLDLGQWRQAFDDCRAAGRLEGEGRQSLSCQAEALAGQGDHRRAAALFTRVLGTAADDPGLLVQRGIALVKSGNPQAGEADFRAAARLRPDDPVAVLGLAMAAAAAGEAERACGLIEAAQGLGFHDPFRLESEDGFAALRGQPCWDERLASMAGRRR